MSLYSVAAEQSDAEHKSRDVYATKLDRAREAASTLTWLNILGNTPLNVANCKALRELNLHQNML